MHNPPGSNNRLNEKTAQNTNSHRLFDSNNNRRGGSKPTVVVKLFFIRL